MIVKEIICAKLLTQSQFSKKGQIIIITVSVGRDQDLEPSGEAENRIRVKSLKENRVSQG